MDPAPAFAGWDLIWSECTEVQLITVLELAELQPCVNIYLVDKKEQKKSPSVHNLWLLFYLLAFRLTTFHGLAVSFVLILAGGE